MYLNKLGIASAKETITSLLYENGYMASSSLLERATREGIAAYLSAKKETFTKKMHPRTLEISQMKVGEILWLPADVTMPVWLTRIKTARRILACDARYSTHLENGKVRITRRENGSPNPGRNLWDNPRAVFLASQPVGCPSLAPFTVFPKRNYLERSVKTSARKILGNLLADWKGWTTDDGVWIERIK